MNELNIQYKVTAEVLTPLSIGQGADKDWVRGIDFVVEDKICYHLDLNKMAAAGVDINRLTALFASGRANDVLPLLSGKLDQVSDLQLPMPCSTDNNIKAFLRNELTGRPVLAGSSLKGAIRSVLFKELFDRSDEVDPRSGQRRKSNELNERTFGTMKDGTDLMRFVRVGDFEFEKTGLIATKIYNLHTEGRSWVGGWKHALREGNDRTYRPTGFNTIYESLLPGAKAEGNIMLAAGAFDLLQKELQRQQQAGRIVPKQKKLTIKDHLLHDASAEELCRMINDHTFDYLDKEYTFFETYDQGDFSSEIINGIADLQDMINGCAPNECVLKMSAGAGFHSITGDWQYEDYTDTGVNDRGRDAGKKKYKSRKIAISGSKPFSLMGFVKLTFMK